jgi:hypothetical protein
MRLCAFAGNVFLTLNSIHNRVQRRGRPHRRVGLFGIRMIITADVLRFSLRADQFFVDFRFVFLHRLGNGREFCGDFRIGRLVGQTFGPVHREIEMRTAVVDLSDFSRRRFVGRQKFRVRFVQSIGQNLRFFIVLSLRQMLETCL